MLAKIWFAVGCVFIIWGLWIWIRKLLCSTEVVGKFLRWDAMAAKDKGQQYAPVFEFELGGERYSCRSFECFPAKKTEGRFKKDQYYKIYVNAKKPKDMIVARKFYAEDYLVFVVAILAFFFSMPM